MDRQIIKASFQNCKSVDFGFVLGSNNIIPITNDKKKENESISAPDWSTWSFLLWAEFDPIIQMLCFASQEEKDQMQDYTVK